MKNCPPGKTMVAVPGSALRQSLPYIVLTFFFFLGQGSYFTGLSPFVLSNFGERSRYIFIAGQIAFPFGYFLSGYLSDRTRRLRLLLQIGLLLQAPCVYLFFSSGQSFLAGLGFGALTRFFTAFNLQLATIAALEARGEQAFGGIRVWGTVAFMLLHFVLFGLESWWPHFAIDAGAAGRLGAFIIALTLASTFSILRRRQSRETYYFRDALRVLTHSRIAAFYLLSFCFYFHYQVVDLYLGQYFKEIGGMRMVFLAWGLIGLVEIPFLPYTARCARRFGIRSLIFLSLGTGALRFALLTLAISGVEPIPIVYTQFLHGIHFAGFYMAGLFWLRGSYPEHLFGTGVGLFMLLSASAGAAAGNTFYGWLLFTDRVAPLLPDVSSPQAQYLPVFGLVCLSHLVLCLLFLFLKAPALRTIR